MKKDKKEIVNLLLYLIYKECSGQVSLNDTAFQRIRTILRKLKALPKTYEDLPDEKS